MLLLTVLAALVVPAGTAAARPGPPPGPPQRYIVVLHDFADPAAVAADHSRRFSADPSRIYRHAVKGYAAAVPPGMVRAIADDHRVRLVELDGEARTAETQSGATWGLDRIDQRALPLNTRFAYTGNGGGVRAYVIDTGIRFSHREFGGRAVSGPDYIDNDGSADDCDGHGTHVAGTLGGATYGVAKSVQIVPVRVLNCSGSGPWSGVISGIDWVTADHRARLAHAASLPAPQPPVASVANMSLGGGGMTSVDEAIQGSIAAGVSYAVAAGNDSRDACNFSPARVPAAMTVGASKKTDRKASFSNWGACVDWFAPGYGITSAAKSSDTSTTTLNGTSMASPHAAGVAALYLQANPGKTPAEVAKALYDLTSKGKVTYAKTANNHLLYTNL